MGKLSSALLGGLRKAFTPKYLFFTNTGVCCSLLSLGDGMQQLIGIHFKGDEDAYDFERNRRVAASGIILGPMNHFWYRWLDSALPGKAFRVVAMKVMLDLVSCPAFSSTFVVSVALQEGQDLRESLQEYRHKCISIFSVDVMVWPPTQLINFYFLPASARVLYTSGVQVFYNSAISAIKHDEFAGAGKTSDTPRPKPKPALHIKAPS